MCDFPGTDALIHHPFSVWFQSIHYLLISPGGGGWRGWKDGNKSQQERPLVYLHVCQQSASLEIHNTPRDDPALSY